MKQFNLEEYLKNPSRKVVTGDGRNVRIICTDAKISAFHSIIALVGESNGNETIITYTNEGRYYSCVPSKTNDLFFAPEKHEGWANVFKSSRGNNVITSDIFESKEEAEKAGKNYNNYMATAKVEWEE